ncbi:MAG: glycosyltransferase [Candidatus Pacebacteria bacterium]|nr:glycosyltransferase [Candidatus Paceibacterota bacterium]
MQTKSTHSVAINVLYVITKSNWGGAQRYLFDIATAAKKDFSVAVATGGDGALVERLNSADIPVFPIESFQRDISFVKEFKAFFELFGLFRKLRPTIVHLNSSKAGGTGALAARLAGVPKVIYTSHGLPFEEDRPFWQKKLIWFFTWVTFLLSHTTIIITKANLENALKMPWLSHRLRLIRNGVSDTHTLSQKTAREKLIQLCDIKNASNETIWVGTIAEYHPNKGLPYLIDAINLLCAKHPHIVCVIVGGGELEDMLRKEIEIKGLIKNVFLAGFLPDAATYLSAFDIVTLTSIKEGLPYVVLEAGTAGIAFVGSAISSIQEIVTDMQSGILVRPKQPKEIAGALSLLIEDPLRRELYGKALKKRVTDDFSAKTMIEKTLSLYTE